MTDSIDVKQFCERVLEQAKKLGADYADIRVIRSDCEYTLVRIGKVEELASDTSYGFGVRVLLDGAWGFSSNPQVSYEHGYSVVQEAVSIAKASASVKRHDISLAPVDIYEGKYSSDWKIDPFDIPLEEKIGLLKDADSILRQQDDVKLTECSMQFWKFDQIFASTEGAYIEQTKIESGAGISATAMRDGEVQTRSYPSAFGGDYAAAGYEFVQSLELIDHAQQTAREAVELLSAPVLPSGEYTLILEGSMLALQVHESCGHPVELDRVFGTESSFAGTSFLTTDKLNSFRYGSDIVNLTADATLPGGLGSFAFDDEGVPAQRVDLVKNGIFSGYLSSRETAAEMGWQSGGAMRSDGWNRIPLIRMTNINLLPGEYDLDELIQDTSDGIYAASVRSWSIDDKRLNFQFGTEVAWEIKDGSLGRMFRNPIYSGITPDFWGSCDAICDEEDWHLWGVPNCGKGEPMQVAHVGHGVAPARFKKVRMEGAQ